MSIVTLPVPDEDHAAFPTEVRPAPRSETRAEKARSLASVGHELDTGSSIIGIATIALRASLDGLAAIKAAIAAAASPQGDRDAAQAIIAASQARLRQVAGEASFNGINLLVAEACRSPNQSRLTIVSAVARDATGSLTIKSIEVDRATTALFDPASEAGGPRGILDRIDPWTGVSLVAVDVASVGSGPDADATIAVYRRQVETAIGTVHKVMSQLSIVQSRINLQSSFIASLAEASASESVALIDTNLDRDTTKQTALQTVRLLHAHSLSIASRNRQTILKLFQED